MKTVKLKDVAVGDKFYMPLVGRWGKRWENMYYTPNSPFARLPPLETEVMVLECNESGPLEDSFGPITDVSI